MRAWPWLLLCSACIVPAPSQEGNKPGGGQRPAAATPAGPVEVRNGANLGGKIEITGMIVNPGRVAPGEMARVTAFFRVLEPIEIDYGIFVHIEDAEGKVDRLNADHDPVGGTYPTSKWKKGETVKDEFQIYVPPGMQVRALNLLMGFWDKASGARLPLKNPEAVRNDGQNRILVAQIPVGG